MDHPGRHRAPWFATVGLALIDVLALPHCVRAQVFGSPAIAGIGRISLKAAGENLAMPTLGALALPLRAQLQAGTGACWEATFATPTENKAQQFRARSP
jgi:hypothetical protein